MEEHKVLKTVVAETAYEADNDDQISFKEGDTIGVLKEDPSGMWKGVLMGTTQVGLFPVTHTVPLKRNPTQIELPALFVLHDNQMQASGTTGNDDIKLDINTSNISNNDGNVRIQLNDVELKTKNDINGGYGLTDASSENYHTYETLNLKNDPNSDSKYGLASHYMSISSSIATTVLGIVCIFVWFNSSPYFTNQEIIYDTIYYLYSGIYGIVIGIFMFLWEYVWGITRSNRYGIPYRTLMYLFIGAPLFWNYHTALAGLFWMITSVFDGLAYKNGETQEFRKKRKKPNQTEPEICCKFCAFVIIVPDIVYWLEDLRNQSKIKKYLFVAVYSIFNVLYILERWYWYYNLSLAANDAAAKAEDVDTKVFGVLPGDLLAQIKDAHGNGYVLSPVWFPIAKMFGNLLDINCAFIVLPVCRTFIRNLYNISTDKSGRAKCFNFILSFMPLDKAIQWHKYMAFLILFGGILHPFAHFMNYNQVPLTYSTLFGSTVWITGTIVLICMHFMFSTSILTVRHAKFEMFWYTHHLFIIFFITLLIHGRKSWNPNFWKWFVAPGLLYITERSLRQYRSNQPIGVHSVTHMNNKHAKIFCLELEKTGPIANFKEGQYIFIRVPIVSKYEWHPFTISSAPHEKNLTLHIRNMGKGSWTDRVQQFYLALSRNRPHKQLFTRQGGEFNIPTKDPMGNPLICIDGPMAAPTQHLGEYNTSVIIGAGIGVTPLRATLQSIIYFRFKHGVGNTYPNNAYCVWIVNHKQIDAYRFMCRTLKEAEDELYDLRVKNKNDMNTKTLKIHIFITSVKGDVKDDTDYDELKSNSSNTSKDLQNWGPHHDNNYSYINSQIDKQKAPFDEVDIYRNLKNPPKGDEPFVLGDIIFHRGRPKWKNLFLPLRKKYKGSKIGVMFCGPAIIANDLKVNCGKYTNHKTNTIFVLHKENF